MIGAIGVSGGTGSQDDVVSLAGVPARPLAASVPAVNRKCEVGLSRDVPA